MMARLVDRKEVAERTQGFYFEVEGERLKFKAGQSADVTLANPKYQDDKGTSRTFSIASSPADSTLLFATRLTGSAFEKSLLEASIGTEVDIKGPLGAFTLHADGTKPAVFVAGGIGVTPFRSIIKDATERKLPHSITLVYSNRTAAGTAFLGDFERWGTENPSFRLVATLTDPNPSEPWGHMTGRVGTDFLKNRLRDIPTSIFYVVGPPAFVKAMQKALPEAGADPGNIRSEQFYGY